jgi:hypothetical protein
MANPGIRMMLQPDELGKRVNEALAGFNNSASPDDVKDYLVELFGAVDAKELGRLMASVVGGFIEAVFSSRDTALAVVKTVLSGVAGIGRNLVKLVLKRD